MRRDYPTTLEKSRLRTRLLIGLPKNAGRSASVPDVYILEVTYTKKKFRRITHRHVPRTARSAAVAWRIYWDIRKVRACTGSIGGGGYTCRG